MGKYAAYGVDDKIWKLPVKELPAEWPEVCQMSLSHFLLVTFFCGLTPTSSKKKHRQNF